MSPREIGELFSNLCLAVANGDRARMAELMEPFNGLPFVGRVYWRQSVNRPWLGPDLRRAVLERDEGHCRQCGSTNKLEIDHVVAFSRGGTHDIDNLQLLCKPCNRKKGAR